MQDITAWLTGGEDFEQGKALYLQYGTNNFFKSLLLSGPTPYNINKLRAELESFTPATPALPDKPQPPIESDQQAPPITEGPAPVKGDPKEFEKYLELQQLIKLTYRQLERNMIELDLTSKESVLRLIAMNIIALYEKKQRIFGLLDHYDEHGTFPLVGKVDVVRSPAAEIQLLRVSNSTAKRRLQGNCRDRAATQQLIQKNNQRIIELGGKVKS